MDWLPNTYITSTEVNSVAGAGGRALGGGRPHFFGNNFEELQTVLFEAELIINNALLTYIYPNTIETCLTPNHLLFGR